MTGKIDCPKATDNLSDLLWDTLPIGFGIVWGVFVVWIFVHEVRTFW